MNRSIRGCSCPGFTSRCPPPPRTAGRASHGAGYDGAWQEGLWVGESPSMRNFTVCLLLMVVFTGCKPGPPPDPQPAAHTQVKRAAPKRCSAQGLAAPLEQQGIPEPVAQMRQRIAAAAIACDFDGLARLAAASDAGFMHSFGAEGEAPASFRESAAEIQDPRGPLALLVKTLSLPHCNSNTLYIWPSAFCDGATEEDWSLLRGLYTDEQIREVRELEMFPFHRAGITASGAWTFFIAGD